MSLDNNICNGPIHGKYQPLCHIQAFFASSHHFFRCSHLKMCDLENVGQSHNIQQLQWRHSMANTSYLMVMAILMFAPCAHTHERTHLAPFTGYSQIKMPSLTMQIKVKIKEKNGKFDWKCSILYEFISEFKLPGNIRLCKIIADLPENVLATIINSIYRTFCTPNHHHSLWKRSWSVLVHIRYLSCHYIIIIIYHEVTDKSKLY